MKHNANLACGVVYFVRHGQSKANREGLFSTPDTPLTETGREQAVKLGVDLRDKNISQIVVSPDLRTRQTAEIIAQQIGIKSEAIRALDELHERRFGALAGTPRRPEKHYAYTFESNGDSETRQQLIKRMKKAIEKLGDIRSREGNLLVVGHTVSGYFMRELLAGHETYEDFSQNYNLDHGAIIELKISNN